MIRTLTKKSHNPLIFVSTVQTVLYQDLMKPVNLQFNTVGRWDDDMIVTPSDGPMIIWIDWE